MTSASPAHGAQAVPTQQLLSASPFSLPVRLAALNSLAFFVQPIDRLKNATQVPLRLRVLEHRERLSLEALRLCEQVVGLRDRGDLGGLDERLGEVPAGVANRVARNALKRTTPTARHHVAPVLGIEPLREGRRADEVAEEHRELAALAGARGFGLG